MSDSHQMLTLVLVGALVFVAFVSIGAGVAMTVARRGTGKWRRIESEEDQADQDSLRQAARVVEAVGKVGGAVSKGRVSTKLRKDLSRAGFYGEAASKIYLGGKVALFLIGLTALLPTLLIADATLLVAVGAAFFGSALLFFAPNAFVALRRLKRSKEVRRFLPDAADLLEVCVSGGMGLDAAWNSVGEEIRQVSDTLADEMALTSLEMHLGGQRTDAMRNMAARTGANEIITLVALLAQSERFGTSLKDALKEFAVSMRETRSQRAEEIAEKMPVKLLFPLVLCIFPVMLIVLVGPAGIRLAELFASGR